MGKPSVVIFGGGPAGLSAAYLLAKDGYRPLIVEADPYCIGGISKTVVRDQYRFDLGPHRFFTKSQEVSEYWKEVLGDDLLKIERKTRIFFKNSFFIFF